MKKQTISLKALAAASTINAEVHSHDIDGIEEVENGEFFHVVDGELTAMTFAELEGIVDHEADSSFLKDMTPKDAELRASGKPRYSTSMLKSAPVPAEGTKTKLYNVAERLALLTVIASRCKEFAAEIYANNQEVFINYWPASKRYTFASAKGEKGYLTNDGAFAFAAVSCDENGIVDAETIRFGNVRKDL